MRENFGDSTLFLLLTVSNNRFLEILIGSFVVTDRIPRPLTDYRYDRCSKLQAVNE